MINIYCDESCHLENDNINVMVLGAIWCESSKLKEINSRIKLIKLRHNVRPTSEIKWSKVGPQKEDLYLDIIDYFFDNDDLHFRGLIVPDKSILNHKAYNQTHDDWYYKMYFTMLKSIFHPDEKFNIYLDIKDTHSNSKCQKLHEVCCNSLYDFSSRIIRKIQPIRSDEVQIMQLVDILSGAIGYKNRIFPDNFTKSQTKQNLISKISDRSSYQLTKSTLLRETKFNLLVWEPEGKEVF